MLFSAGQTPWNIVNCTQLWSYVLGCVCQSYLSVVCGCHLLTVSFSFFRLYYYLAFCLVHISSYYLAQGGYVFTCVC